MEKIRSPQAWGAAEDRRLEKIASRLGLQPPSEPLHLFLHGSTDRKEAAAGDDDPFTLEPGRRAVHHLVSPIGEITDARGHALLLLRLAWGEPGSERMAEAVARYAVGAFQGHPLRAYAARIVREEEPYPLRDVLQLGPETAAPLSPLVMDALGGAWVERMREREGMAVLRKLWSASLKPGEELEQDWRKWLSGLPAPPRETPIPRKLPFLRGISFSHEVRREGYGSDVAAEQLARMRRLGANAVAIVPYAFTRAPDEPSIRYRGTDESDARVIRAIRQAKRLGLRIILKPQVWSHRFTGNIVFARQADFDRWFADYRRWMLHQARLAALERADLLVIGTELGGLTRQQAAWRSLIRDVRRIYSGPVTYAANWAGDFEQMPFWDALDVLGLNMYYPLAGPGEQPDARSPRVRELKAKLAGISRRHRKPILFTEVGYAASAAAAVEPWKEDHAPLDPQMQARCYEVVFQAFSREPWLAGLFWWKWPSHGQGDPEDSSFSPLGKPALKVLEQWYGGSARR